MTEENVQRTQLAVTSSPVAARHPPAEHSSRTSALAGLPSHGPARIVNKRKGTKAVIIQNKNENNITKQEGKRA